MSTPILISHTNTPVGELILGSFQEQLCLADWRFRKMRASVDKRVSTYFEASYEEGSSSVIDATKQQLDEYFQGDRSTFDIPLALAGSPFQKSVWEALLAIPYGETKTYLELSRQLGDEKAIRAVAAANGANAVSIIIPCHRIIGSDGDLIGYAGGLPAKRKLLQLEKADIMQQMSLF